MVEMKSSGYALHEPSNDGSTRPECGKASVHSISTEVLVMSICNFIRVGLAPTIFWLAACASDNSANSHPTSTALKATSTARSQQAQSAPEDIENTEHCVIDIKPPTEKHELVSDFHDVVVLEPEYDNASGTITMNLTVTPHKPKGKKLPEDEVKKRIRDWNGANGAKDPFERTGSVSFKVNANTDGLLADFGEGYKDYPSSGVYDKDQQKPPRPTVSNFKTKYLKFSFELKGLTSSFTLMPP